MGILKFLKHWVIFTWSSFKAQHYFPCLLMLNTPSASFVRDNLGFPIESEIPTTN